MGEALLSQLPAAPVSAGRTHPPERAARRTLRSQIAAAGAHVLGLGEPGCGAWRVVPRLGLIGMLAGWWQVKLSSGCPLPGRP